LDCDDLERAKVKVTAGGSARADVKTEHSDPRKRQAEARSRHGTLAPTKPVR
jgi:hypothetical protein